MPSTSGGKSGSTATRTSRSHSLRRGGVPSSPQRVAIPSGRAHTRRVQEQTNALKRHREWWDRFQNVMKGVKRMEVASEAATTLNPTATAPNAASTGGHATGILSPRSVVISSKPVQPQPQPQPAIASASASASAALGPASPRGRYSVPGSPSAAVIARRRGGKTKTASKRLSLRSSLKAMRNEQTAAAIAHHTANGITRKWAPLPPVFEAIKQQILSDEEAERLRRAGLGIASSDDDSDDAAEAAGGGNAGDGDWSSHPDPSAKRLTRAQIEELADAGLVYLVVDPVPSNPNATAPVSGATDSPRRPTAPQTPARGAGGATPSFSPPASSRGQPPYYRQGDISVYTKWYLRRREAIKYHPQIMTCVKKWWDTGAKKDDTHPPVISRTEYLHLLLLMYHALVCGGSNDPSVVDVAHATETARDDVRVDFRGHRRGVTGITIARYHDSLYQLVDNWSRGCELDEYVRFLSELYEYITVPLNLFSAEAENRHRQQPFAFVETLTSPLKSSAAASANGDDSASEDDNGLEPLASDSEVEIDAPTSAGGGASGQAAESSFRLEPDVAARIDQIVREHARAAAERKHKQHHFHHTQHHHSARHSRQPSAQPLNPTADAAPAEVPHRPSSAERLRALAATGDGSDKPISRRAPDLRVAVPHPNTRTGAAAPAAGAEADGDSAPPTPTFLLPRTSLQSLDDTAAAAKSETVVMNESELQALIDKAVAEAAQSSQPPPTARPSDADTAAAAAAGGADMATAKANARSAQPALTSEERAAEAKAIARESERIVAQRMLRVQQRVKGVPLSASAAPVAPKSTLLADANNSAFSPRRYQSKTTKAREEYFRREWMPDSAVKVVGPAPWRPPNGILRSPQPRHDFLAAAGDNDDDDGDGDGSDAAEQTDLTSPTAHPKADSSFSPAWKATGPIPKEVAKPVLGSSGSGAPDAAAAVAAVVHDPSDVTRDPSDQRRAWRPPGRMNISFASGEDTIEPLPRDGEADGDADAKAKHEKSGAEERDELFRMPDVSPDKAEVILAKWNQIIKQQTRRTGAAGGWGRILPRRLWGFAKLTHTRLIASHGKVFRNLIDTRPSTARDPASNVVSSAFARASVSASGDANSSATDPTPPTLQYATEHLLAQSKLAHARAQRQTRALAVPRGQSARSGARTGADPSAEEEKYAFETSPSVTASREWRIRYPLTRHRISTAPLAEPVWRSGVSFGSFGFADDQIAAATGTFTTPSPALQRFGNPTVSAATTTRAAFEESKRPATAPLAFDAYSGALIRANNATLQSVRDNLPRPEFVTRGRAVPLPLPADESAYGREFEWKPAPQQPPRPPASATATAFGFDIKIDTSDPLSSTPRRSPHHARRASASRPHFETVVTPKDKLPRGSLLSRFDTAHTSPGVLCAQDIRTAPDPFPTTFKPLSSAPPLPLSLTLSVQPFLPASAASHRPGSSRTSRQSRTKPAAASSAVDSSVPSDALTRVRLRPVPPSDRRPSTTPHKSTTA